MYFFRYHCIMLLHLVIWSTLLLGIDASTWAANGIKEYWFSDNITSWDKGVELCGTLDATLVMISSEEENTFISRYTNGQSHWIGIRSRGQSRCTCNNVNSTTCANCRAQYEWYDGTVVDYEDWIGGEPSYECGLKIGHAQWGSGACPYGGAFPICQRGRQKEFDGVQYKFSSTKETWTNARQHCENQGFRLASIPSIERNSAINDIVSATSTEIWLGLRQGAVSCDCTTGTNEECEICRSSWIWTDGITTMTYENWDVNEPNDRECGFMKPGNGKLVAGTCATLRHYVCEKVTSEYCSSDTCKNGGLCRNGENGFSCYCRDPHSGPTCEKVTVSGDFPLNANEGVTVGGDFSMNDSEEVNTGGDVSMNVSDNQTVIQCHEAGEPSICQTESEESSPPLIVILLSSMTGVLFLATVLSTTCAIVFYRKNQQPAKQTSKQIYFENAKYETVHETKDFKQGIYENTTNAKPCLYGNGNNGRVSQEYANEGYLESTCCRGNGKCNFSNVI